MFLWLTPMAIQPGALFFTDPFLEEVLVMLMFSVAFCFLFHLLGHR